jgi:MFS family permease
MAEAGKRRNFARYIVIVFIAFVGGFITKLPYIMGTYYTALEAATGLTRTQLGLLSSIYGIVNFIVYLPGGYLADKVSAKKLVVIGGVGTGLFGLWYALLPGFVWLLVIHMGFAITSVFIFWAAMVKAVNNLGTDAEQGKMFGFLEGTRYGIGILATYGSILVFNRFAGAEVDQVAGFKGVIVYYSIGVIVASLLTLIFYKEAPKQAGAEVQKRDAINFKLFWAVLKYPHIWMCGIIVFLNYLVLSLSNYFVAYLVEFMGMDASQAAFWITNTTMIYAVVCAYLGGWIADKIGSRVKFMAIAFVGMTVFAIVFFIIPAVPSSVVIFLVAYVLWGFCGTSIKALYFSTIGDVKMPAELAGSASSVISLIGYLPDMFIYAVAGSLMDKLGHAAAFKVDFGIMIAGAVIGLLCCFALIRMINRSKGFGEKAA